MNQITWSLAVFALLMVFFGASICLASEAPSNEILVNAVRDACAKEGKTVSSVTILQTGAMQTAQTTKGAVAYWIVKAKVEERGGTRVVEGPVFQLPAGVSYDRSDDGKWDFQKSADDLIKRVDQGDVRLVLVNERAKAKGEQAKVAEEIYFSMHNTFTDKLSDLLEIDKKLKDGESIQFTFGTCDKQGFFFSVRHVDGNKVFEFRN